MEFKRIRTINKRKIIVGGLISLSVISALIYLPSRAKYRNTQSFPIANGTINYKVPDFGIVAMYTSEDGENYTELTGRIPSGGYIINEEKSYCTLNGNKDNNVTLKTVNGVHSFNNLIKGDNCYLYFDVKKITISDIIAVNNPKPIEPNFANIATIDEGVFAIADGMYEGASYYWRGAVENNYVNFANFCWRIIRINGDGSVRLIYDGTTCHQNGEATTESIALTSQSYNSKMSASYYVGYTYTSDRQRPSNNATATASNLKTQTDSWFSTNITGENAEKVADGKFCNDRNTASGSTWAAAPSSSFYYATQERLDTNKTPTLKCPSGDVYTMKAGAITADEVSFAGGVRGQKNSSYYLYNGQGYWTMSPYHWYHNPKEYSTECWATMVHVDADGSFGEHIAQAFGIRPVINLKADTVFSSGDGTLNSPYTV